MFTLSFFCFLTTGLFSGTGFATGTFFFAATFFGGGDGGGDGDFYREFYRVIRAGAAFVLLLVTVFLTTAFPDAAFAFFAGGGETSRFIPRFVESDSAADVAPFFAFDFATFAGGFGFAAFVVFFGGSAFAAAIRADRVRIIIILELKGKW
jgi:hypothetical protein